VWNHHQTISDGYLFHNALLKDNCKRDHDLCETAVDSGSEFRSRCWQPLNREILRYVMMCYILRLGGANIVCAHPITMITNVIPPPFLASA
jgi:hypothetical protein